MKILKTIDYIILKVAERLKIATSLFYETYNNEQIKRAELIELIKIHLAELEILDQGIITPEIHKRYIDNVAKFYTNV